MSGKMLTIDEVIMTMLKESGLDPEDETVQQLAGSLSNLFQVEWNRAELAAHIQELEMTLQQKNKMLYGNKISDDIANRNMIDPKILMLRLQGLRKARVQ